MQSLKTKFIVFFFASFLSFLCNPSYAQKNFSTKGKFKTPVLTIEVVGSYAQPLPNMYGEISEFITFSDYGLKYGASIATNFKYHANKQGTVRPFASIGYTTMWGNDNRVAYIDSNIVKSGFPLITEERYDNIEGYSKVIMHNFTTSVGIDYIFWQNKELKPYIGTEFNMNIFWGNYTQDPIAVRGTNTNTGETSVSINRAVRFGFGLVGGIQYRFTNSLGMVFSTKYKLANLFGKNSERTTFNDINVFNLLDESNTELSSLLKKSRNMNYLEFGFGIVFFIGKK
jgi:hypothetical protein